jgi:hypothetical protein
MGRGRSPFRKGDFPRAIARAAGLIVDRAWIETDGRIILGFATSEADRSNETEKDVNPWDKALAS